MKKALSILRSSSTPEVIWILVICFPLLVAKLYINSAIRTPDIDGGLYSHIAQHVRNGSGLVTNISLYHKGLPSFPYPSALYPAWPLLLGLFSRVLSIDILGIWLPSIFYGIALYFSFLWAKKLPIQTPNILTKYGLHSGHLLLSILGSHVAFFQYTSLPYTEGLSYALLFAFLHQYPRFQLRKHILYAVQIGIFLGVLFFCRSQFILITGCWLIASILDILLNRRKQSVYNHIVSMGCFVALIVPYIFWVDQHYDMTSTSQILRYDRIGKLSGLTPLVDAIRSFESPSRWIADKILGLRIAFNPFNKHSYSTSYGLFHYCVVLCLLSHMINVKQTIATSKHVTKQIFSSHSKIFLCLLTIFGFLSIHSIHKQYWSPWSFSTRQGMTTIFLIFFGCVSTLNSRFSFIRAIGLCTVLLSFLINVSHIATLPSHRVTPTNVFTSKKEHRRLAKRLDEIALSSKSPIAVGNHPQQLIWQTKHAQIHQIYELTSKKDLSILFNNFHINHLAGIPKHHRWMRDKAWMHRHFIFLEKIGNYNLYQYRAKIWLSKRP